MNISRTQLLSIGGILVLGAIIVAIFVMPSNDGSLIVEPSDVLEVQTLTQPMPVDGNVEHPEFGKQTYFSYGAISGTQDVPGNGVIYGRLFQNKTYFHTINLNIEVAPAGSVYIGWLKNDAGDLIKTGQLYNRFGDVRYSLQFDVARDLSDYKNVIVSREANDEVTAPSTIIATGTLKETKQGK